MTWKRFSCDRSLVARLALDSVFRSYELVIDSGTSVQNSTVHTAHYRKASVGRARLSQWAEFVRVGCTSPRVTGHWSAPINSPRHLFNLACSQTHPAHVSRRVH